MDSALNRQLHRTRKQRAILTNALTILRNIASEYSAIDRGDLKNIVRMHCQNKHYVRQEWLFARARVSRPWCNQCNLAYEMMHDVFCESETIEPHLFTCPYDFIEHYNRSCYRDDLDDE